MLIVNESVKFLTVVLVIKILQLFTVICQVSLKRSGLTKLDSTSSKVGLLKFGWAE